ncbi:HIT domain-containing protein [Candidatus Microgenomates bacterium]|nr:HIT domain-containing protein [Candidatus Microgenomates bacterium]
MSESDKPTSTDKIHLEHARTDDQLRKMEDIAERGICFMCPEQIPEFYQQEDGLIEEGEHLYLVHNGYPYENTDYHIMAIPKQHVTRLEELSQDFWLEALEFFKQLEASFGISGGAIAMRFGNPAETGATVHHLHIHFIVPSRDIGPNDQPVRFRMSRMFKEQQ